MNLALTACSQSDEPTISLYLAIKRGDIDQIERHINWGTNINQINIDGQTPLHELAITGRIVAAKLLLKHGAEINKLNNADETALFLALKNGRTQLAKLLITDFNADFKATEILFKIINSNTSDRDVIEFLINNGAEINSHNEEGKTPLIIAVENQQLLAVKHLIANHADVNVASKNNNLPLDIAEQTNNSNMITLLTRNGAQKTNN